EPAPSRKNHRVMGMSQAPRYWLSVSRPASATSAPQNRAARLFDSDFCERSHSDKEETVSAKQNTVAGGIAARLFSDSRPATQIAKANQPMRGRIDGPTTAAAIDFDKRNSATNEH